MLGAHPEQKFRQLHLNLMVTLYQDCLTRRHLRRRPNEEIESNIE